MRHAVGPERLSRLSPRGSAAQPRTGRGRSAPLAVGGAATGRFLLCSHGLCAQAFRRRISATVSDAMNRLSSARPTIHLRLGGFALSDIAGYVGVEDIAGHRSTSRPSVTRRASSKSAPTRGERRSAATMPPRCGGSPAMIRLTASRILAASLSFLASRLASDRISARSVSYLRPFRAGCFTKTVSDSR
jgi:hypothetical protein